MSQARIYLSLTDVGLTAWTGAASNLKQQSAFANDDNGFADFERFVDANRHAQYAVLFDLPDEDCRLENIPHVNSRARGKVLTRRLNQLYRGTSYRNATLQGRDTEGRRDDRVLYTALTNSALLDRWLGPLVSGAVRITGIYSVALLTARHARRITQIPPRALIASRQFGSGLRQTYIADGSLRFSRLTPLEGDDLPALAKQLSAEASRARQFLASLRAIDRAEVMYVVMLCSESEAISLAEYCPDSELIHYQFTPLSLIARSLGVTGDPELSTAEPIWLRYIAAHRPSNQYANKVQRGPHLAWQMGRALLAGAAVSVVSACLAVAWLWQGGRALQAETSALQQRQFQAEAVYAANVPKSESGDITPTGMKNVVLAYRQLVEQWPELIGSLNQVSGVLTQFPEVELDELGWQVSKDPQAPFLDDQSAGATPPASAAAPSVGPDGNPLPNTQLIMLRIKGTLPHYAFRYRDALAMVDGLNKAFQTLPGARAEITQQPIDVKSANQIKLDTNSLGNQDNGAPFVIKVTMPIGNGPTTVTTPPAGGVQ